MSSRPGGRGSLALAALLAGAAATPAAAANALPVPTEKSACYDPAVHDGVRGHLLFTYLVDAAGRVSNVSAVYKEVEPPDREARLVGHMIQCLEGWKYRPGVRGGKTVSMGLMTPFHFFAPAPADDPQVPIPGGKSVGHSRLEEMREAKLRLIDQLLSGRQYAEVRGSGWVLRTDLGAKDVNTVRRALDLASRTFDALFPGLPPVQESRPVTIVAFRDNEDQDRVSAFDNLIPDRSATGGIYSPLDRMMCTAKGPRPAEIMTPLLVHEMTHHLIAERLYPGDRWGLKWVHEGIGTFLESLDYGHKEPLDLAAVEKTRVSGGGYLWRPKAEINLSLLRQAQKKGPLPHLADMMSGKLNIDFFQAEGGTYYATSWLVVHYLINAEGGRYRAPFQAWMTGPQWGGDGETLAAAIGKPLAQVEADLPAYLAHLK